MKFIHTSDLQIGKVYSFFDKPVEAVLQDARQTAIRRIGELAHKHGVTDVLVAGDVYDHEQTTGVTLKKPIEGMRRYERIRWWLMPGNHDPHADNGLWAKLAAGGLPANVRLCVTPEPVLITEDGFPAYLLPAPLRFISAATDQTEWMDGAVTPAGAARIGLAHGSIRGFDSEGDARNLIDPVRAKGAGLAYLALGDWHRQIQISDRTWYSGTPEPDRFRVAPKSTSTRCNGGRALLVELDGPTAVPRVTPVTTGHYVWHLIDRTLTEDAHVDQMAAELEAIEPDLSRAVVRLRVSGTLSLGGRKHFEERVAERFGAAVAGLRLEQGRLIPTPTETDLDEIDRAGFVRVAADRLRALAADPADPVQARIASLALSRLYLEHVRTGGVQ
jgi:DNA repair exonuclease SbcCD nuclease subunit